MRPIAKNIVAIVPSRAMKEELVDVPHKDLVCVDQDDRRAVEMECMQLGKNGPGEVWSRGCLLL
jgi:hypothetical protein